MPNKPFLTTDEEKRGLTLARDQPRSAKALLKLQKSIQTRAVEAVLADPLLADRLKGTRYRILGGDLRAEKTADGKPDSRRLAEGGIYDYGRNVLIVPIVDLRRGTLINVEERVGFQPPITEDEFEEAKRLVWGDQKFRALRKRSGVEAVAFVSKATSDPNHPAYGHRCFTLYFWTGGRQPKRVAEATVDLSTQKIVPGVEEPGRQGGRDGR